MGLLRTDLIVVGLLLQAPTDRLLTTMGGVPKVATMAHKGGRIVVARMAQLEVITTTIFMPLTHITTTKDLEDLIATSLRTVPKAVMRSTISPVDGPA